MVKQQFISINAVIRTMTILLVVIIISFSCLVGFFLYLIEEGEAKDLHTRIALSLNVVAEQAMTALYEYSYWDEAYLNLVQEKQAQWITSNINDYLLPEYGFDFLAVLDSEQRYELIAKQKNSFIDSTLIQTLEAPAIEDLPKEGTHFYHKINDVMYDIVVSPFISEITDMKQKESLVVGIAMKDDYLSHIASKFRIPPLTYSLTTDTKYRVKLNDFRGKVQSSLVWDIVSPTREILPYIIASALILLMVSYFIIRRFLFREFHSRAQYEEVLYDAATKDSLTKIANRQFFYDHAEYSFKTYRAQNRKYSLLLFDLDHFKDVNDKFGVIAGNSVLVHFTKIVQRLLREGDSFGRVGGKAFAIFLPDTDSQEGSRFAERVRIELKKNPVKQHEMNGYVINFSAGLATHELDCTTMAELTNKTGEALYEAKKNGRNITIVARSGL